MMETPQRDATGGIVLFDGVCNLCNASVRFIIDRDPRAWFRFASLQSEAGRALIDSYGIPHGDGKPMSIVLIEGARWFDRSSAALRIARRLRGAWPLLFGFIVIPRIVRDAVYRFIARNRYRWFGKTEQCMVPAPEIQARFLT